MSAVDSSVPGSVVAIRKSLSLKTNLQVLVLGPQVLVVGTQSPQKLSRTLHSVIYDHHMKSINLVTATVMVITY